MSVDDLSAVVSCQTWTFVWVLDLHYIR